jgi:hypothetical protein
MIEGKHFRSVEARRRTVAEAIDRYVAEELPRPARLRTSGVLRSMGFGTARRLTLRARGRRSSN